MTAAKTMVGLAGVVSVVAVAIATHWIFETRRAAAELAAANQKRDALVAQVEEKERRIREAQRRTAENERDSGELLKAVAVARTQGLLPRLERPAGLSGGNEAENRSAGPGSVAYRQEIVDGKMRTTAEFVVPSQPRDEEQQRLAHERAYQQATARKRMEDAKLKAQLDEAVGPLGPSEKYDRQIEVAEQHAANGDFPNALRVYKDAMKDRPADLPVSDRVTRLGVALQEQSAPVDVTFASDALTHVFVVGYKSLGQFGTEAAKILPGNYRVVGRRDGFQDVVIPLQVRNGVMAPTVSVVCTEPVER